MNRKAREGTLGCGVDTLSINNHTIYKKFTPNLPHNPNLKGKAKALRKAGVLSEVLFWQQVHQKKFYGIDFDRQHIIGHYIVDFYVKSLSLVIEIDGSSHDAKGAYDEERQMFLASLGLNIHHIEDKLIKQDIGLVMRNLEDYIIQTYSTPHNSPSCLKGWQPTADGVDLNQIDRTPRPAATPLEEGNDDA